MHRILGAYRGVDGQTYYRHTDGKVCSKGGDHWLPILQVDVGDVVDGGTRPRCQRPHPTTHVRST